MADRELKVVLEADDRASSKIRETDKSIGRLEDSAISAAKTLGKVFVVAVTAATTAVVGLGFYAVKVAAEFEQNQIAFETMLGSAEKADKLIKEMVDFAKRTPFELRGLQTAAKQLLAYGSTQDTVLKELQMLGDIASGVGMDKLPNLILAFGQVRAATKLTGMELRQFTEAGVPLLDELAKHYGTTAANIKEMVEKGKIGFPDVQAALANLTGEGGRFFELMEKQSQSLNGRISTLKDAFTILMNEIGQALLPMAKEFVNFAITNVIPALSAWGKLLAEALPGAIASLRQKFQESFSAVGEVIANLRKSFDDFISGFVAGWQAAGGVGSDIKLAFEAIRHAYLELVDVINRHPELKAAIESLAKNLGFIAGAGIVAAIRAISMAVEALAKALELVIKLFDNAGKLFTEAPKFNFDEVARKLAGGGGGGGGKMFQHGGIVPGSYSQAVPAILHGGERVTSRHGVDSGQINNNQSTSINFYGNMNVRSEQDIYDLSDRISQMLDRQNEMARQGVSY